MRCPPYLMTMRVRKGKRFRLRLWLPFFLLWPLALVLLVFGLVGSVIVDLCYRVSPLKEGYTRLLLGAIAVFGETRGTTVYVDDAAEKRRIVALKIY